MKRFYLLGISLLVVAACAPQPSPPASTAAQVGSAANTSAAFDGDYGGAAAVKNMSTGRNTLECPDSISSPYLIIQNGRARFQGASAVFEGYVTPQGGLTLQGLSGQTFQGQIDPNFVVRGWVTGPTCTYALLWTRQKTF
jgi:hypothetical protein